MLELNGGRESTEEGGGVEARLFMFPSVAGVWGWRNGYRRRLDLHCMAGAIWTVPPHPHVGRRQTAAQEDGAQGIAGEETSPHAGSTVGQHRTGLGRGGAGLGWGGAALYGEEPS